VEEATLKKALKTVCFLLCFIIFSSVTVFCASADDSYVINGVTVPLEEFPPGKNEYSASSNNCFSFTKKVYKEIWGVEFKAWPTLEDNILRNVPVTEEARRMTAENLKKYVSHAAPGSVMRISKTMTDVSENNDNDDGHSFIIVDVLEDGFVIYDNSSYYGYRLAFVSWSKYANEGSNETKYIKYIKNPLDNGNIDFDQDHPPISEYELWKVTTEEGLRIRKDHSTSAERVTTVSAGTLLYITEFFDDGQYLWGKSSSGWCALNYCEYKNGHIYGISFDANGGTDAPEDLPNPYSVAVTLPEAEPVRDGYDFKGWSVSAAATVPEYAAKDAVDLKGDVILYAVWKEKTAGPENPENPERPEKPEDTERAVGDVNGDLAVNLDDALILFKYVAGVSSVTEEDLPFADTDVSGAVNLDDALYLFKTVSGIA